MHKISSILILIFNSTILIAQQIDIVEKKLDSLGMNINSKVDYLNEWVSKNYRKSPTEAIYYSEQAQKLAKKISYHSGKGLAKLHSGLIHYKSGNYNTGLKYYNSAIKSFLVSNDSLGIHRSYVNRGLIFLNLDKYDLAIKDFITGLNYFEKVKNYKTIAIIYNNIGLVYKHIKDYSKALEYYKKAALISNENQLISPLYLSNTNIANILSIENKFQEALSYYKRNLDVLKKKPNKYKLAQTYHNIGTCFLEMKQYQFALEYLQQSLKLKEEIGNKNLMISTLNNIAHTFYMREEFHKALEYRKKSLRIATETNNLDAQKSCNQEIFQIFTFLNQADSAMHYFGQYKNLRDSILNKETLKQIADIQAKYEAEKKENQIAVLEKENKSKLMQRNGLLLILGLLLAYAIFIVRSYYRNKKMNHLLSLQKKRIEWHRHILDRKNKDLQASNQTKNKLFQIISHDLRSPLASISGISKLIPLFIKQAKYESLNETSKDLEQCVSRVLDLTDNLLSWSMNQSGKLPYNPVIIPLKKLLSNNLETYKLVARQKSIHLELVVSEKIFVFADRHMLDTIIRNLINNSVKFTPAGGVIVLGAKELKDHSEIWVKDSGVGISTHQLSKLFEMDNSESHSGTKGEKGNGLGLILCKEFITRNKGEIWVESKEGVGSTFRFTVPNAGKMYEEEFSSSPLAH